MKKQHTNSESSTCPHADQTSQRFSTYVQDGLLLLVLAVGGYLAMALWSYSEYDPGWARMGPAREVDNLGGPVGAWMADLLLTLFGVLAFLLPLFLLAKSWLMLRARQIVRPFDGRQWLVRTIGLVLCLVCGTTLASLQQGSADLWPSGYGGILGAQLSTLLLPLLSLHGTALITTALFLFGITLLTDLSFFVVLDKLGIGARRLLIGLYRATLLVAGYGYDRFVAWREERQQEAEHEPQIVTVEQAFARLPETLEAEPVVAPRVEPKLPVTFDSVALDSRPEVDLLDRPDKSQSRGYSAESLEILSRLLELRLKEFGVLAEVVAVHPGPVITRFEIQPAAGIKVSKITNLAKDLARSLTVVSVRVVEVISGKSVVGIEIPNEDRETVFFSELIGSQQFAEAESLLTMALGHDIAGQPVVADLAKMPHLLVAGTTGSGKSVGVNAMILSLLYKASPADVRMIMVDPKMLELSVYDGIPHLLTPVITDMKEAANGLRWCVAEMERRYRLMAALGVRNIGGFNRKVKDAEAAGEPLVDPLWKPEMGGDGPAELTSLPFIVVVVDEFADMMMIVGKKVEELIARLAQKARAAGIHLILATQRPSVDVITGLIKANVPTRISFQVSSKIDSRTILDQGGAEQLLGHGDMLYLPPGTGLPVRVHGAFVSDEEVHRVVADWKQKGEPCYVEEIALATESGEEFTESGDAEQDPLYDEAVAFVTESRKVSISSVQRRLKIGYNRSANLIEAMERAGVISSPGNSGAREVLAPPPVR